MQDEAADPHAVPLQDGPPVADTFPVAVLMQCSPVIDNRWLEARWELIGLLPARQAPLSQATLRDDGAGDRIVRYDGLKLRLYADEAESYYHNLMVPEPQCFVVSQMDETDTPRPMLVTASFDEASAYAEGDDRVDSLPLPAALLAAIEAYVLTHYVPTKRAKRKRTDWKQQ